MAKVIEATEVITTGRCPLDCSYCYIPKTEAMNKIHEEIKEWIVSGAFLDALEAKYGEDLKHIGFWGTEPTLTLLDIPMEEVFKRFPILEGISFSTAMLTDPGILVDFITSLIGHEVTVKIQVSLDGPDWITDVNRIKDATEQIPKNIFSVLGSLADVDLKDVKVAFSWKPTHSIENIKYCLERPERIGAYYGFFKSLNRKIALANKNENITFRDTFTPTLVVPGKYTSSDGRLFAEYVREVHGMGFETTYTQRLARFFKHENDLHKRRQFSCSAGDANLGMARNIHICHRTFYYDYPEYIDAVLRSESSLGDVENWDVAVFERNSIDFINRNFIVNPGDKWEVARFHYTMRGYHDFWRHQLAYTTSMVKELARAGQVNERFLRDESFLYLFSVFLNVAMSCPMENLLNTGSIHLQPISLMRIFGNGAFEEFINRIKGIVKK